MNIVLKNSLKNIFGKPFRTLLVVFAIFVCCFCALLSFDLGGSITRLLTDYIGSVSRADIMVNSGGSDLSVLPEELPDYDYMGAVSNSEMLYKDIDGEYCYVTTESLTILGLDIDEAVDMEFIVPMEIGYGEMYVTQEFADDYGYETGDKITVHDRAGEEMELTIGGTFPENTKNPLLTGNMAIVSLETSDDISCGYREIDTLLIDFHDDSKIEEGKDLLEETYPDVSISDLFISDSDMQLINEIRSVFYLLFAITFLLVIFVTASICNRIVSERMSYIGTLRSLGMSTVRTGRILLLENVLYAVLGSVPATAVYMLIRDAVLNMMFNSGNDGSSPMFEIPKISPALVAGVILGAILIECLIPLRAILKALKTSIRDIIFDNRDTEYRFSRTTLILGIGCLVIAAVTFFMRANLLPATLCLLASVGATAFLFPRILKIAASAVKNFSDKHNNPSWSLAAVETISRKSTVGSGVLCATAAAMAIVVFTIASVMAGNMNEFPYNCDVVIDTNKAAKYYTYIDHLDGVNDTELLYKTTAEFTIGEEEKPTMGYVFALPDDGFRYYDGFTSLPDSLEPGNVLVSRNYASRKGFSEGDTITLTYNPRSVLPIVREYTVAGIVDNASLDGVDTLILNQTEYTALFKDKPGQILINCEDPEVISSALETYGKGTYEDVNTRDEMIEQQKSDNSKTNAVTTTIAVIALGMTAIGMISNQLIGFEGRKKECAVMLSTAMGRGKLSGILLKEMFITSVTASGIGVLVGTFLTKVLEVALENNELMAMDVKIDPVKNLIIFAALVIAFTGTVLFPIRNLKKMKISEQIKYE